MNHLQHETSPYLQQHAHQPVDWHAWNAQALEKAKQENKPILLSIGYSACHWCHVMAHESFDDPETAAVMNNLFVNIKVDREERPDLDKIYQQAHFLLNRRSGGWPLNVILTPHGQVPFFSGTYFPKDSRYGMPRFVDVLKHVASFYAQRRDEIEKQNASLLQYFADTRAGVPAAMQLDPKPLRKAEHALAEQFDQHYGGFGSAPKFPHPSTLQLLFRLWLREEGDQSANFQMLRFTMEKMARGGLYDQLGGGFFRYSVDEKWEIPHFEKMLYDNGPLLSLYTALASITGDPLLERTARGVADWVLREMQSAEGGFYATLDADTEGEEGKFYLWTPAEVANVLPDEDMTQLAMRHFGLDQHPNFEGKWHMQLAVTDDELGPGAQGPLNEIYEKLFTIREQRVRPGRDEKMLVSWNALMVKALAETGRLLQEPRYVDAAERAVDFIRQHLYKDGRLWAVYKDGQARLSGYLDDYVFLVDALYALLQSRWRHDDLLMAESLCEAAIGHFADEQNGAFYFTADDAEALFHRPQVFSDDAMPAGNAVATVMLVRLGYLLGRPDWLQRAEKILATAWPLMDNYPHAHCAMLIGLDEVLHTDPLVIVRGRGDTLDQWRQALHKAPNVFFIPADEPELPDALKDKTARGDCVAYICEGSQCGPPVSDLEQLKSQLHL